MREQDRGQWPEEISSVREAGLRESGVDGYGTCFWELGRIFVTLSCVPCPSSPIGPLPHTLAMCSSEEADLLRLEEVFSTTLARTNRLVLQPLLLAGESGPRWPPGIRVLPC